MMDSSFRQNRFKKMAELAKLKYDQDAVSLRAAADAFRAAELQFEDAQEAHQRTLLTSPVEQNVQEVQNLDLADHNRFVVFQEQTLQAAKHRLEQARNSVNQTRKIYDQSRLQLERCRKLFEVTRREAEITERKVEQAEQDAAASLRSFHHR